MAPLLFESAASSEWEIVGALVSAIVIVCIVAVSVFLCGGKNKEDDAPPKPADEKQPEPPPSKEEAPKEEAPAAPAPPPPSEPAPEKSNKAPENKSQASASVMMKGAQSIQLMSQVGGAKSMKSVRGSDGSKKIDQPSLRLTGQSVIGTTGGGKSAKGEPKSQSVVGNASIIKGKSAK